MAAPLIVLVAAMALAQGTAETKRTKITFVGAFDSSGQRDPAVTNVLSASINRSKRFTIVPSAQWLAAAEAADLEISASLRPPHVAALAEKLGISTILVAYVITGDALAARIELQALDASTGRVLVSDHRQVSIDFGAGSSSIRLSRQQADRLSASLISRVRPTPPPKAVVAPPPSPEPTPTPTPTPTPVVTAPPPPPLASEGDATPEPEASLESLLLQPPDIKVGANVTFAEWIYFFAPPPGKVPARHEVSGALQLTGTTTLYTAAVRLLARSDFGDPARNRLEAEEAWIEVGYGGLRLRAGRNIIVWDPFVNALSTPSSPITPKDDRDFVRGEVLPLTNLRLAYDLASPFTFELYYLPVPERSFGTFAPQGTAGGHFASSTRWYLEGSAERSLFPGKDVAPLVDAVDGLRAATPTFENAQGVARAFADLTWLRLSLAYGYVLSLNPTLVAGPARDDGTFPVSATYARQHLVHFAGAMTLGIVSTGVDVALTASPDLSSVDAGTTLTVGVASPPIAEVHRFGGGLVVLNGMNLAPTFASDPVGTSGTALLDTVLGPYAYYSLGPIELITVVVQIGVRAPNLVNLTQLSLRVGPVTTLLAASTAWGASDQLLGKVATADRLELAMKAGF